MNSIRISQNILALLTGFAGVGLVAAAGGLILSLNSLALFAAVIGALVLLVAAHDYAPRQPCAAALLDAPTEGVRRAERIPLAA